jgi:hypothetical protein
MSDSGNVPLQFTYWRMFQTKLFRQLGRFLLGAINKSDILCFEIMNEIFTRTLSYFPGTKQKNFLISNGLTCSRMY